MKDLKSEITARPRRYIAIAARTLGLRGISARIRPETDGERGFVIMYIRTSQTSRVPVPIVFPFSSCKA